MEKYKYLIITSGPSSLKCKDQLIKLIQLDDFKTIAWGYGYKFYVDHLNIYPDFWWYLDASTIVSSLQEIVNKKEKIKTELMIFDPIVNHSMKTQRKYTGGFDKHPDFNWSKDGYDKYLKLLDDVSKYINIKVVDSISYHRRFFPTKQFSLIPRNVINGKVNETIMNNIKTLFLKEKKMVIINFIYDKLCSIILPTCYRLGFKNIYLSGFDGKSGLFFSNHKPHKEGYLKTSYKTFLPQIQKWIKDDGYNIFSLSELAVITKYVEYVDIEDLLK